MSHYALTLGVFLGLDGSVMGVKVYADFEPEIRFVACRDRLRLL